ncbi:DUF6809 family protein [Paenibacillus xylanexedens]|uniref:DUF6809 family protein n=1 Tax=Paenibacillus xylanexedens TaxID=528191 RepID=UPI0034D97662
MSKHACKMRYPMKAIRITCEYCIIPQHCLSNLYNCHEKSTRHLLEKGGCDVGNIIEKLYYGNLRPEENIVPKDSEYRSINKEITG